MPHTRLRSARTFWNARAAFGALPLLATGLLAGCGGDRTGAAVPGVVPARGKLLHKGAPLAHFQVTAWPEGGRPAVGASDADGRFSLGTNRPDDGALPGTHPVTLVWVGPPSTDPGEGMTVFTQPGPMTVRLDPKYGKLATSGLTITIPPGGGQDLAIDVP